MLLRRIARNGRLIICTGKTFREDFLSSFATDPATVDSIESVAMREGLADANLFLQFLSSRNEHG